MCCVVTVCVLIFFLFFEPGDQFYWFDAAKINSQNTVVDFCNKKKRCHVPLSFVLLAFMCVTSDTSRDLLSRIHQHQQPASDD